MSMVQRSGVTATTRPRAPVGVVYEEFSPISEWKEEDQSRVLLVYLPGFRKEQLKVSTEGTNNLRIRGERFVGGRKRSRFHEEYQIPTDSTITGIHAKFETGILTITMPKINILEGGPKAEEAQMTQNSKEKVDKQEDEALDENTGVGEASKTMLTSKKEEQFENPMEKRDEKETTLDESPLKSPFGNGDKEKRVKNVGAKVVEKLKTTKRGYMVNVGVAAIVIVALGVYISYAFRSYGEISNP